MKKVLKHKGPLTVYFLVYCLFWLKAQIFLDPDLGWRIRAGELYSKNGIPATDPFTYTMPSYPWVDHAWGLSYAINYMNNLFGKTGLAIAFSLIALTGLILVYKPVVSLIRDKKIYEGTDFLISSRFFPHFVLSINPRYLGFAATLSFFLAASLFFTFFGIRVQVVSWLLFSLLIYFANDEEKWNKWRWISPFYFLFWANLHGSFVSGMLALSFLHILRFIRKKAIDRQDIILFFLSILFSLANPYGIGVWREVWSSVSDSSLRFSIVEWMPALTMFDLAMVYLIGLSTVLLIRYRKKFKLEEFGLFLFFLLQAIATRRHLPLWAIIAGPLVVKGTHFLWQEATKDKGGKLRFAGIYKYAWLLAFSIFLIQTAMAFREAFAVSVDYYYPEDAVFYLRQNQPTGRVFSEYGWGGYLILNYPEKKVFVDGRMPSWEYKTTPVGELQSAFDTYNQIMEGDQDYQEVFRQFGIDTVLWSRQKEKDKLTELYEKAENYLTIFGWEKKDFDLLEVLEANGWRKVYEDDVSVIYADPKNSEN